MCYMIAVGVSPPKIPIASQTLGRLAPVPDYVAKRFESTEQALLVDVGHCVCGMFTDPITPKETDRLRRKYKTKGWSESRVQRVLEERSRLGGLEKGLVHRLAAAAKLTGKLSLLVWWDDGQHCPSGPVLAITAQGLIERPYSIAAGTRLDIVADGF